MSTINVRTRRIIASVGANIIAQTVNFIQQFALVPVFLTYWGATRYGEWLTLSAALVYLGVINVGVANYVNNRLRDQFVKNDLVAFRQTVGTAIIMAAALFSVGLLILIFAIIIFDFNTILGLVSWQEPEVKITVFFLGLNVLTGIVLGIISSSYIGVGEYGRPALIGSLSLLLSMMCMCALLYFQKTIAVIAFAQWSVSTSTVIFVFFDYRRRHRSLAPIFNSKSCYSEGWQHLAGGSLFQLISFSQIIIIQGTVLMLSRLQGGEAVALFVAMRTLTVGVGRQITQVFNHGFLPELTTLKAEANHKGLITMHRFLGKFSLILVTSMAIFLCLFGDNLFVFWLKKKILFDFNLLVLFVIYLIVQHIWIPVTFFPMSGNKHKPVAYVFIITAIIFVATSYFCTKYFGLYGTVLSLIGCELLIMATTLPIISCRYVNDQAQNYFLQVVAVGISSSITSVTLCYFVIISSPPLSLPHKLLIYLALQLAYLSFCWKIWLSEADRFRIYAVINTLIRRKTIREVIV